MLHHAIPLIGGFMTLSFGVLAPVLGDCTFAWKSGGGLPGVDGAVGAAQTYDDGTGSALYVGGTFAIAGNGFANNLARWDGSTWSAVMQGQNNGVNGPVSALAVYNGELIVAGSFSQAGGVNALNIARWNGNSWSALGGGIGESTFDWVSALAVYQGELVAAGNFSSAGGVSAWNIAKWNGTAWSALGPEGSQGVEGRAYSLAVHNNELIVGGRFSYASGVSANNVARWNGTGWSALGTGLGSNAGEVRALTTFNGDLIAGGKSFFIFSGGLFSRNVARWNGAAWSALGSGLGRTQDQVNALLVYHDQLIAAGRFATAGGDLFDNIAQWNPGSPGSWSGIKDGSYGTASVSVLTVYLDLLVAGGGRTSVDEAFVGGIAAWNGTIWSALGAGAHNGIMGSQLNAFAIYDGELIAGGQFISAGGVRAMKIAGWNGSAWFGLGDGLDGYPGDFGVYDDRLIVAGYFPHGGGLTTNPIPAWDGSSWSMLPDEVSYGALNNTKVTSLITYQGELIVGGDFTFAGIVSANNIARWNGTG